MNQDERIPVSVVIEESLLAQIDALAKAGDMNRSQYLRKLAREAVAKNPVAALPQKETVAA